MKQIFIGIILGLVVVGGIFAIKNYVGTGESPVQVQEKSELQIQILQEGEGVEAKNSDKLSVHYTGTLEDGTKFDSSLDRDTPFEFVLGQGQVIQGWEQGLLGMKVGEKRKLIIPPELAYKDKTLIFEVELLEIN